MKKVLYLLIAIMAIMNVSAAAPILKSVGYSGAENREGVYYFDRDETPKFVIQINATANYSAICNDANAFTAASACNENVTTGCVAYSSYSSGTSKTISYTPTTTNTAYTVYCAACAKGAACDSSAISGGNTLTFKVRTLSTIELLVSRLIMLIICGFAVFVALNKSEGFRTQSEITKFIIIAGITVLVGMIINIVLNL